MRKKITAIAVLCVLVAGLAFGLTTYERQQANATETTTETAAEEASTGIDIERIMAERSLGSADAPVVIKEFASLSCSHCAAFSNETFDQIKEEYIDTGKVRFIFNDFPLNASALDGTIVARCLPEERYFKFIKFLFETQEEWAFERNYQQILLQNAKLLGGDGETLQACLESEELKQAIVMKRQEYSEVYKVQSTPSFVVNETHHIMGAQLFPVFKNAIDNILEESEASE